MGIRQALVLLFTVTIMALSEEEKKQRHKEAVKRYNQRTNYASNTASAKKNSKMYGLRLSYSTDADLMSYLDSIPNLNGYLRKLLRDDMQGTSNRKPMMRIIPLLGTSFAAGRGESESDVGISTYSVNAESEAEFAIHVSGDSMEPYLPNDSIQLCVKAFPQDGEVGVFMVDGDFYVKQCCTDYAGNLHLFSLNRAREDMDKHIWATGENNVLCFGKVIMAATVPLPLI